MSTLRRLASDTALFGLSSILGRLVNYLLVPLYVSVLTVAENGVVTGVYAVAAFANVLATLGIETGYFRHATRAPGHETLIMARGQRMMVLAGTGVALLLIWAASEGWVFDTYGHGAQLALLLGWVLLVDTVGALPMARLRLARLTYWFVGIRLGTILLNVAFNVLFLVVLDRAALGRPMGLRVDEQPVLWVLLANLLANLPYLGLWVAMALAPARWRPTAPSSPKSVATEPISSVVEPSTADPVAQAGGVLAQAPTAPALDQTVPNGGAAVLSSAPGGVGGAPGVKALLLYSLPVMLTGLVGMGNEMAGRLMLEQWLPEGFYPGLTSLEALGIYGNCYKLSIFMALVIQAFRMAAEPFFFSRSSESDAQVVYAQVMAWFILAGTVILVGVSVNLGWLSELILRRPVYRQGLAVVPVLLAANLLLGIYYNLTVWFKIMDRTLWGTWTSLAGLLVTLGANFWLIPRIGYMGSALATLACYTLMAALCYGVGQRYYPVPYPLRWAIIRLAVSGGIAWGLYVQVIEAPVGPARWLWIAGLLALQVAIWAWDLVRLRRARPLLW